VDPPSGRDPRGPTARGAAGAYGGPFAYATWRMITRRERPTVVRQGDRDPPRGLAPASSAAAAPPTRLPEGVLMNPKPHRRPIDRRTARSLVAWAPALVFAVLAAVSASATSNSAGPVPVSGTGVHAFSTAIVHSQVPTESGMVQRSSEIVTLQGDLNGYVLYHPVTTIDEATGTMVNTGQQVFSGTVLGSEPVLLFDDRFRFEVDLQTGATVGSIHLGRSQDAAADAPWFTCELTVVGTGMTDVGDALAAYEGTCERHEP